MVPQATVQTLTIHMHFCLIDQGCANSGKLKQLTLTKSCEPSFGISTLPKAVSLYTMGVLTDQQRSVPSGLGMQLRHTALSGHCLSVESKAEWSVAMYLPKATSAMRALSLSIMAMRAMEALSNVHGRCATRRSTG